MYGDLPMSESSSESIAGWSKSLAYTSALEVTGTIRVALDATVESPANAWTLEDTVWNANDGYPRTVSLHEQRLVAAGSPGYPQTVWMSRIGENLNFEIGTTDDDAMSFTISSDQINLIAHLGQLRALIALTYGGEFTPVGRSRKADHADQHSGEESVGPWLQHGATDPHRQRVVFRAARQSQAAGYGLQVRDRCLRRPDLSVLAEHATESGVVDMAYQQEPESVMWLVRGDGVMATVTIDRDQDVVGWARQITDGVFGLSRQSQSRMANRSGHWCGARWAARRCVMSSASIRHCDRCRDHRHTYDRRRHLDRPRPS